MDHRSAIETTAVERYFLDEMPAAERSEFEEHFFECEHCAEDVRVMSCLEANARAVARAERPAERTQAPKPALRSQSPGFWERYFNWLRPAIAAPALASLLVVMGYQNLLEPARSHDLALPHAATQLLLRGETRGTVAGVNLPSDHSLVLTLDLAGIRPLSEYTVELQLENGPGAEPFQVSAPAAGEPLTLSLPAGSARQGRYQLTLRSVPGGPVLARFRFEVHP
ncbi:MAG: zf-HC2 domain-containing protein [Acidobacteria bacterium]|nr:zf-HC2 domain-containing protein [Acidobacteriota bacterium]